MNFEKLIFSTKQSLIKHGPAICTTLGIVSMVAGAVLAVKETPTAVERIKEADISKDAKWKEKAVGTVKATWKNYILPVSLEMLGVGFIAGSAKTYSRRYADLSNVLYISEAAYRNLQNKMEEKLTQKQVDEIRDSLAEDRMKEDMPDSIRNEKQDDPSYDGKRWFHDAWTGNFFRTTDEELDKTIAKYNKAVDRELYITQNQLIIDLGENGGKQFEDFGWEMGEEIEIVHKTYMDFNGGVMTDVEYTKPHQLP